MASTSEEWSAAPRWRPGQGVREGLVTKRRIYSIAELSEMGPWSKETLRERCKNGKMPAHKDPISGEWLVDAEWCDENLFQIRRVPKADTEVESAVREYMGTLG